jgi:hypothetical protein
MPAARASMAIERQPGPFQSASDQADIKALLDKLLESDAESDVTPDRPGSLSLVRLIDSGPAGRQQLQAVDFEQAAASDALQVTVQPGG